MAAPSEALTHAPAVLCVLNSRLIVNSCLLFCAPIPARLREQAVNSQAWCSDPDHSQQTLPGSLPQEHPSIPRPPEGARKQSDLRKGKRRGRGQVMVVRRAFMHSGGFPMGSKIPRQQGCCSYSTMRKQRAKGSRIHPRSSNQQESGKGQQPGLPTSGPAGRFTSGL